MSVHRYMREDYHWAIFIDQLTDVMQLSARQSLNLASITTLFSEVGHPSCRDEKRRKFYMYVCVTWPTSENSKRFFERKISSPYQLPHYIACRTASYSLFWQSSLIYLWWSNRHVTHIWRRKSSALEQGEALCIYLPYFCWVCSLCCFFFLLLKKWGILCVHICRQATNLFIKS